MTEHQNSPNPSLRYKQIGIDPLSIDEEKGIVSAWVSVFDVKDYAGDRTIYGKTFSSQIKDGPLPYVVWMHQWDKPIGKTLSWEEVPPGDQRLPENIKQFGGLLATMQFNLEKQAGKDAFSDIKGGFVKEYSYGYEVVNESKNMEKGTNDLLEVKVMELSPVLLGCNPLTSTDSVKSAPLDNEEPQPVYTRQDLDVDLIRSRFSRG